MILHLKHAMPDLQRYLCNVYLINNVEDIVVFLDLKLFEIDNSFTFSTAYDSPFFQKFRFQ